MERTGEVGWGAGSATEGAGDVTRLLTAWSHGEPEALDDLMPLVLDQLRQAARDCLRRESADHTLQATALVHELYLHLRSRRGVSWEHRRQFVGYSVVAMRRILVDHARRRRAKKRGDGRVPVPLEAAAVGASRGALMRAETPDEDLLALDEALHRLARLDPRQARVVELRFFGGLAYDEIARVLDVSPRTARRAWQTARLWLRHEIDAPHPA